MLDPINKQRCQAYRNVFSKHDGPKVLTDILSMCGMFDSLDDTVEAAVLKNFGSRILKILGGGDVGAEACEALIQRVVAQPLEDFMDLANKGLMK